MKINGKEVTCDCGSKKFRAIVGGKAYEVGELKGKKIILKDPPTCEHQEIVAVACEGCDGEYGTTTNGEAAMVEQIIYRLKDDGATIEGGW